MDHRRIYQLPPPFQLPENTQLAIIGVNHRTYTDTSAQDASFHGEHYIMHPEIAHNSDPLETEPHNLWKPRLKNSDNPYIDTNSAMVKSKQKKLNFTPRPKKKSTTDGSPPQFELNFYPGSMQREIIALQRAFPIEKDPYKGRMFIFKPKYPPSKIAYDEHLLVLHNTTMKTTDHLAALGETLTEILHPTHFQKLEAAQPREMNRYKYSNAFLAYLHALLPSTEETPLPAPPPEKRKPKRNLDLDAVFASSIRQTLYNLLHLQSKILLYI